MPVSTVASNMSQSSPSFEDRLTTHVRARLRGWVHDFCVQRRDECLVLMGWAYTYYAKQLAQQYVRELTDLIVTNEIKVLDTAAARPQSARR
jgi:hypothetical protein